MMAHRRNAEMTCEQCGKPFAVEKYRLTHANQVRFCSRLCYEANAKESLKRSPLSDAHEAIIRAYRDGATMQQIAADHGVTKSAIYHRLARAGVPRRQGDENKTVSGKRRSSRSGQKRGDVTVLPVDEIRAAYEDGEPIHLSNLTMSAPFTDGL
jgi:hypothetical protein